MYDDRPDRLAQMFHEEYERQAPAHGYETRTESAKPWKDVPEANKKLMIAVARTILQRMDHARENLLAFP